MIANPVVMHPLFDPFAGFVLALPAALVEFSVISLFLAASHTIIRKRDLFAPVALIHFLTVPLAGIAYMIIEMTGPGRVGAVLLAEIIPFGLEPLWLRHSLKALERKGRLPRPVPFDRLVTATAAANVVSLGLGLLLFGLPYSGNPVRDHARRTQCAMNLKEIGTAIDLYRKTHDGEIPSDLAALASVGLTPEQHLCHAGKGGAYGGYVFNAAVGSLPIDDVDPAGIPVAWDRHPFHQKGRNVLFLDGHVETLPEEEFRRRIEKKR